MTVHNRVFFKAWETNQGMNVFISIPPPGILLSMKKSFASVGLHSYLCGKTSFVTGFKPAGRLFTSLALWCNNS